MLNLSELKQTRFYQEVKQEGIEEGLEQGREQGKQQAKLDAIPRMITFGLNPETISELLDLPPELVQQIIAQLAGESGSSSEPNESSQSS